MKFLHTADWQLGMRAAQEGGAAERVRAEPLKTVERIIRLALDQTVDFILLAGDTFEDNVVERVPVPQAAELLALNDRQLVVLDDVLTFTDAARMARVLDVLEESAQRLQILIITCHPERYRGLNVAKFFDLEEIVRETA